MSWHPVADDERVRAELLDGRLVEMKDLKLGEIFRCVAPDGMTYVHPYNHAEDDCAYAMVCGDPIRATDLDEHNAEIGYAVQVMVAPLEWLKNRKARMMN